MHNFWAGLFVMLDDNLLKKHFFFEKIFKKSVFPLEYSVLKLFNYFIFIQHVFINLTQAYLLNSLTNKILHHQTKLYFEKLKTTMLNSLQQLKILWNKINFIKAVTCWKDPKSEDQSYKLKQKLNRTGKKIVIESELKSLQK